MVAAEHPRRRGRPVLYPGGRRSFTIRLPADDAALVDGLVLRLGISRERFLKQALVRALVEHGFQPAMLSMPPYDVTAGVVHETEP